jgi:hypothetical protein
MERVVLTGEVAEVAPYLEAMDVFCLPSQWEGSPMSFDRGDADGTADRRQQGWRHPSAPNQPPG